MTMRDEETAFGLRQGGGSKAFIAAGALLACLPACGSITEVGTTPPAGAQWQQATCLISRTECSGWVEDDSTGLDGVDVNCPTANFVPNDQFTATICYSVPGGSTFDEQKAAAEAACDQYCSSTGFLDLYPLGSVANKGGPVTCLATQTAFANEVPGQCSKTAAPSGPSPGATTFALCKLSGRACDPTSAAPDGTKTAKDGTQFCVSMPPVVGGQSTSGCFDSTVTTAELLCQNMFQFPKTPANAANNSDQFHFWEVDQVELNATETDCQNEANNIGFAAYGVAPGLIGKFTLHGATTSLTAKGGALTIRTSCNPETELCTTTLGTMKLELADVTVAGLTLHNPEATLIAPATATFELSNMPANSIKLEIEGDVTALGRAKTVFSNAEPLALENTATSATLSGAFSATLNTSLLGVTPVTGNISISASTSSPNVACADESALQQLLGFETTADWTSPHVSLALTSSLHTQGCFGLEVGGCGYRTLNSAPFATPLPGTTQTVALDIYVPPNPPDPQWLGAVQMYLTCPSANFFNQYIGQDELTGLPLGKFSTLKFPIPAPIESVLKGSHPDCFFSIAVNSKETPTPPVLDNLRFK
jgi:hypothetical protein